MFYGDLHRISGMDNPKWFQNGTESAALFIVYTALQLSQNLFIFVI